MPVVVYAPNPTRKPTPQPTFAPTWKPGWPTPAPSDPTALPTLQPTAGPSVNPTEAPTPEPSPGPGMPTHSPTVASTSGSNTVAPTRNPTAAPSAKPSHAKPVSSPGAGSTFPPTATANVPSMGPTGTHNPTMQGKAALREEEFFESLPLYAKVLFTFAIISLNFAVIWFIFRKIIKPRMVLYSRHSDEDSEHAGLTGARSPMGGFIGGGNNDGDGEEEDREDDDGWGGGADSHHSDGHTPALIRQPRRTPLSARLASASGERRFRSPIGTSVSLRSVGESRGKDYLRGNGIGDGIGHEDGDFRSEDFQESDGFHHFGY